MIPTLHSIFLPSDDFCTKSSQILLTDHNTGTYQLFHLGSRELFCRFFPRAPNTRTSQPVSHAKFISENVVVGGGVGQLVLWNIDTEARLQNLTYRNQGLSLSMFLSATYWPSDHQVDLVAESISVSSKSTIVSQLIFAQSAYRQEDDSGWIVTAHNFADRGEVIIWRTAHIHNNDEQVEQMIRCWDGLRRRGIFYCVSILIVSIVAFWYYWIAILY